jgi:hypothetical protein
MRLNQWLHGVDMDLIKYQWLHGVDLEVATADHLSLIASSYQEHSEIAISSLYIAQADGGVLSVSAGTAARKYENT